MNLTLKRIACVLALTAAAVCLPSAASAGMLNILISNFDIAFDGTTGEITDFQRPAGGNLDPGESRTVSSFELEADGVSEALLMNPPDALFADLKITNLGSELTTGALVQGAGGSGDDTDFGFDFYTTAGGGTELRLGIDDISYTVVPTGIPGLNFFNYFAEAKVLSQSLPNGRLLSEDVIISYTATEVMTFQGQNGVRTLVASGQMTITGNMAIPEPATASLFGLACVAGIAANRRRRR